MRNPFYNKIPSQKIIQKKRVEPDISDWDELNHYKRRKDSTKARNKRKEARYVKEARIYGE